MSQPNHTNTSPMATCTCSHSTGCSSQPTEVAKPTVKPTTLLATYTTTQCSCSTTSNPSHHTTCPRESTPKTNFGTIVVAGCNITSCQEAIAIPPPDQPRIRAKKHDFFKWSQHLFWVVQSTLLGVNMISWKFCKKNYKNPPVGCVKLCLGYVVGKVAGICQFL